VRKYLARISGCRRVPRRVAVGGHDGDLVVSESKADLCAATSVEDDRVECLANELPRAFASPPEPFSAAKPTIVLPGFHRFAGAS